MVDGPNADTVPSDGAALETAVVAEVSRLRDELTRPGRTSALGLDQTFDRIGLGSLELTELMMRLEERFGVMLPADLLATAESPRDLVVAVARAPRLERPAGPRSRIPAAVGEGDHAGPAAGETLAEVLEWHSDRHPDRAHVTLVGRGGVEAQLTYGELRASAMAVAGGLLERGVTAGDSVALVLPTGLSYFETFMGVVLAGAVPVPIYPPTRRSQLAEHLKRQSGILQNARAVELVTVTEAKPLLRVLRAQVPSLHGVLTADELSRPGSSLTRPSSPNEPALVQYTSGSTGDPKGVVLTHTNLLSNIRAMAAAAEVRPDDVFVSWLPLYHDMGLIGAWLGSLTVGMQLVVMSPVDFLTRPSRWLWAMHEHGGTISAGPNFAYSLCVAKIPDDEIEGLDLSRWRLAFNGAEPVSADTLERFAHRFKPYGFRKQALAPVYGLAESSVGLAFPPAGRGPIIDQVYRDRFLRGGIAEPCPDDGPDALRFVACGRPLPGHQLRVVDAAGAELPDRREGRIHFRGPSATSGYLRNPTATRSLFSGDWLDTGDLGYLAAGDLYVTGRVKDMIVRAGRNLHPEELEEAVGELPDVRTGCVAVFGAQDSPAENERLVVVAETRVTDQAARSALRRSIIATCVNLLDVPPDEVALVRPGTVPKTSSGKIRRTTARELYRHGGLEASRPRRLVELGRLILRALAGQVRSLGRRAGDGAWSAYAWCAFVVAGACLMVALTVVPGQERRRGLVQHGLRGLLRILGVPLVIRRADRLPTGPAVLVANHPSWIDALVLQAVVPTSVTFVAGEVLADQRLAGFVSRRLGTWFVERVDREHGVRDTRRLADRVRAGDTLMMFPEGHIDPRPGLRSFRLGAFVIATEAQVPVTPVVISGTRRVLPPGAKRPRRGRIVIRIEEPISPHAADWAATVALQNEVRGTIAARCEEPDLEG